MAYKQMTDTTCNPPSGRVWRGGAKPRLTKQEKISRKRAAIDALTATTRYRAALHDVRVREHDSSWCHMIGDDVLARFDSVSDAVSALIRQPK